MRYTRRLFDWRSSGVVVFLATVTAGGAFAACSSSDESSTVLDETDAGPHYDGSPPLADASVDPVDAAPERDAEPFDGAPLPVVCTSPPCATSLVTTRGANDADRAEGFCALLDDGTVACWGAGGAGQLGRGSDAGVADSPTAARVSGLQGVVSLDHTCALDNTGAIFCWGTGPFLQSATVATTKQLAPVKLGIAPATKVAVGISTGCALVDGKVLCWGANLNGEIAPLETTPATAVVAPQAIALPDGGAPVEQLVVGYAAFAILADKTVLSWGANPPLARTSSLFPDPYPLPIALDGVSTISLAEDDACATAQGIGYCWGTTPPNPSGPTSTEPRVQRALPTSVQAPEPLVQIASTRTQLTTTPVQPPRWCGVAPSGAVYCWGFNGGGQAGDGTKNYADTAVRVVGLPGPAAQVKTTPSSTCALLANGKVYCWGTNLYGQLGNGTLKLASLSPQEVVLP